MYMNRSSFDLSFTNTPLSYFCTTKVYSQHCWDSLNEYTWVSSPQRYAGLMLGRKQVFPFAAAKSAPKLMAHWGALNIVVFKQCKLEGRATLICFLAVSLKRIFHVISIRFYLLSSKIDGKLIYFSVMRDPFSSLR